MAAKSKIKHLISEIRSPEGLNPTNLKLLYLLLHDLSMNHRIFGSSPTTEFEICGFDLQLKDIHHLSHVLFKELETRFHGFFSALHDRDASAANCGESFLIEQLTLLLRCCLVLLVLNGYDQFLVFEKGRAILSILSRLVSIELGGGNGKVSITFNKLVSRQCVTDDGATSVTEEFVASLCLWGPSDPRYAFLCAILEVFADELLVRKSLREYFVIIDSSSAINERLFACPSGYGDIGSVLEVICAHFVVSLSDEQAFENFLNRLFWCHGDEFRIPEMSLPATLSLLLNPIMVSAPKMFQAYVVVMVSEVIGICLPQANTMLNLKPMDCYVAAFERSAFWYTRHMSSLCINGNLFCDNDLFIKSWFLPGSCSKLTFESFLQPATRDKLHHVISKSHDAWDLYLSNMCSRTNSELMTSSIAFVKENLCIIDESYKEEVLSVISCIILRCSSYDIADTKLHKKGETSPQDIYLLASILKLTSSSMLQAIWHVRHSRFSGCVKSQPDISRCKGCDVIVDILDCFEQFSISLPIQKFLCELLESHPARHRKSKWMLLHISGLLQLSYVSGLDFLVKNCLFALMAVLDLFIVEEGDLGALGSLFHSTSGSSSSKSPYKSEGAVEVPSRIRKIQETYLRTRSTIRHKRNAPTMNGTDSVVCTEDAKESCNGKIFLKCLLGKNVKSDIDDLADFIECEQGKDYSGWLRNRQKFRLWKYKKTTVQRWKRKKMSWNHLK